MPNQWSDQGGAQNWGAIIQPVKEEVGIQHEDELVQALIALTEKIPPLALGTAQRTHRQSRMLARKLLKKHMPAGQEHDIETIIANLKSNLYFHGHPINRHEAKDDLKLKVEYAEPDLENAMWNLYEAYEEELKLNERFNPLHELDVLNQQQAGTTSPDAPITTAQILAQIQQLVQAGLGLGGPGQSHRGTTCKTRGCNDSDCLRLR